MSIKITLVFLVQRILNTFGLQVRRLRRGVNLDNSLEEQLRLSGENAQCVLEVGAANGRDTAIYAKRLPRATVHAFEPLPANFEQLALVAANEPRIRAVNCAVAERAGKATFHVTALPDASSLLKPIKTDATYGKYLDKVAEVPVTLIALDDYCAEQSIGHIDILKMDAQGAELSILKGAEKLLRSKSIRVIYTEVDFVRMYEGMCLYHHVAQHLEDRGYRLHSLYNLVQSMDGRMNWGDAIFVQA